MKIRKLLALVLVFAMTLALAACGGSSKPAEAQAPAAPEGGAAAPDAAREKVTLRVWGGEEDQALLREQVDAFIALHADKVDLTIDIGVESESTAKGTILTDPTAAADVFAFASDQINDLVNAGAIQAVQDIPGMVSLEDIQTRNSSVSTATVNGTLYAFPFTDDNCYFMFYDSSVFTEEDVKSFEKMLEVAEAAGKKVQYEVSSGWYLAGYFAAAGLTTGVAEDGVTATCDWNTEGGVAVCESILNLCKSPAFMAGQDGDFVAGMQNGNIAAGINGPWNASVAQEAWGENYAATKLPTVNIGGEDMQMHTVTSCKLMGVNPHSAYVGWAMALANYLTNADNQLMRFQQRGQGPSNLATAALPEVSSPALDAIAEQGPWADATVFGGKYWDPAAALGQNLYTGDGVDDLQGLLDEAVAGITQPVVG